MCLIDIARDQVEGILAIEDWEYAAVFRKLPAEFQRARDDGPGLLGSVAINRDVRADKTDLQWDLAPPPLGPIGQGLQGFEAAAKVAYCLHVGRPVRRPLARSLPVPYRIVREPGGREVLGQELGLVLHSVGKV